MPTRIGPRRPLKVFIAEWREAKGLTQKQLAERLDVSEMTVSRWERGTVHMNTAVMAAVGEALGLLDSRDILHHPDQPSADALLRDQPDDVRTQALRVIEALRKAN